MKFFSLTSNPFKNAKVHKSCLYAVFDKDFEPISLQNHDTCETDEKCFALFIQIWQHCDCVNVKASDAEREDLRYHCEICEPRPVEKVRVWSLGGFTEYSNRQRTTPTSAWSLGGFTEYSNRQRTTPTAAWSLGGFTEYSNRQRTTPTSAWSLGGFTEYSNRQRTTPTAAWSLGSFTEYSNRQRTTPTSAWSLGGFTEYSNRQRTTPTAAWSLGGFTEYSNRQRTTPTSAWSLGGWACPNAQAKYRPCFCLVPQKDRRHGHCTRLDLVTVH